MRIEIQFKYDSETLKHKKMKYKKLKSIFLILMGLLFFCPTNMIAQIEVQSDNTVKITENVTVKRNDTDNPVFNIQFDYNVPNTNVFAIKNFTTGVSKQRTTIQNATYGTLSLIHI